MSDAAGVAQALLGGWDVGGIVNGAQRRAARCPGRPARRRLSRRGGSVFGSPAPTCTAVINTPGGGASRNVRRPNLVPGVDPYLKNGLQWLNPAAFAMPAPGKFGNLERDSIRGPTSRRSTWSSRSASGSARPAPTSSSAARSSTCSNRNNYDVPPATLPNALGTGTNQLQPDSRSRRPPPGRPSAAAQHRRHDRGMGTNRQAQFALRVNF